MADTGKPLPITLRLEIRQRRESSEPMRKIADALGVSKTTVNKYKIKLGTNSLNSKRESA